MSLSSMTNTFVAVIDLPNKDLSCKKTIVDSLLNYLGSNSEEYYFIFHDKDINESGELKTPHFHLCCRLSGTRKRLTTILKELSTALSFSSKQNFLIDLKLWKDYIGNIQYLIHKNNPDKYQYNCSDIFTNSKDTLDMVLNRPLDESITIEYLIDLVDSCCSLSEVYRRLGLSTSSKYRALISDIYKDRKGACYGRKY